MPERSCQARSAADWQGREDCPCQRDESHLMNAHWAGGAANSTSGHGERRRQGWAASSLSAVCSLESSLKSKDHGAGNAKARGRETGKD